MIVKGDIELLGEQPIINAYQNEFEVRLRNRKICNGLEEYQQITEELVHNYLEHAKTIQTQTDFTKEELCKIIQSLSKNKAPGEDQITAEILQASGNSLIESLLDLYNHMKNTFVAPHKWEYVIISTIYKKKGSKKLLVNYRGIFLTSLLCKIFEKLIKGRIKEILGKVNKFQAGARSNRSVADNLFLLRGTIDHYKYLNKKLFLLFYDYKQAFDSLWLDDCILSLWRLGCKNEFLPLIYELNKRSTVKVKTPYGYSTSFTNSKTVKQGTVLGSDLCSVSTAECCCEDEGVAVGEVIIAPLSFVDDIENHAQMKKRFKDVTQKCLPFQS